MCCDEMSGGRNSSHLAGWLLLEQLRSGFLRRKRRLFGV